VMVVVAVVYTRRRWRCGQPQLLETRRSRDMFIFLLVTARGRVWRASLSRMRGEVALTTNVLRVDRRGPFKD
jgi:hypothetical protein